MTKQGLAHSSQCICSHQPVCTTACGNFQTPPHSLDLVPCDFLSPKMKLKLKEKRMILWKDSRFCSRYLRVLKKRKASDMLPAIAELLGSVKYLSG